MSTISRFRVKAALLACFLAAQNLANSKGVPGQAKINMGYSLDVNSGCQRKKKSEWPGTNAGNEMFLFSFFVFRFPSFGQQSTKLLTFLFSFFVFRQWSTKLLHHKIQ